MLDKNDIKQMREIALETLADFFQKTLAPYFDQKFKEIDQRFKSIDQRFDDIDKKFEENDEQHQRTYEAIMEMRHTDRDHEKRIAALESPIITSS